MCFRPPTALKPVLCPECGAKNPNTSTSCRVCGHELTPDIIEDDDGAG